MTDMRCEQVHHPKQLCVEQPSLRPSFCRLQQHTAPFSVPHVKPPALSERMALSRWHQALPGAQQMICSLSAVFALLCKLRPTLVCFSTRLASLPIKQCSATGLVRVHGCAACLPCTCEGRPAG